MVGKPLSFLLTNKNATVLHIQKQKIYEVVFKS